MANAVSRGYSLGGRTKGNTLGPIIALEQQVVGAGRQSEEARADSLIKLVATGHKDGFAETVFRCLLADNR